MQLNKAIFFLLFLVSTTLNTYSQVEKLDAVTISLNQSTLSNTAFPFDVPFNLIGKVPDNSIKIIFSYKVSDKEKKNNKFPKWISLPDRGNVGQYYKSGEWTKSPGEDNFLLYCNGIHPNIIYDFKFEIIKDITNDDNLKKSIRKKLADKILNFTSRYVTTPFGQPEIDKLDNELTDVLKSAVITDPATQSIKQKKDVAKEYIVSVRQDLKFQFDNLMHQNDAAIAAKKNLYQANGEAETLADEFDLINKPDYSNQLSKEINSVIAGNASLNDFSKALLDVLVSPSIDAFKGYTVRTGLLILKKLSQSPKLFEALVNGKAKISNNDIVSSDQLDAASISFIYELVKFLDDGNLVITATPPNNVIFTQLNNTRKYLKIVAGTVDILVNSKVAIESFINSFPDLTLNIVLSSSLTSETRSIPDVTTQSTPYISVDGGIGYSTTFQSAFSYYGANFYFSPVNKKAKLSRFKGINKIKKIVCFNIGIANLFGDRPLYTTSILGTNSKSDLFVGLGFRTGRIIKINLNCMPYNTKDNPITNETKMKFGFVAGVGIDVNLLGAFGTVAKTLNLTQ